MSQLKSAKQILEEIGFKKDSPESTQFAFLRHLKNQIAEQKALEIVNQPVQLEFDLEDHSPKSGSFTPKVKKVSNP